MAITFDTLEYVNELKAADVSDKQAQAQAKAMRRVLDTALTDHSSALATKADLRELELRLRSDMAALENKLLIRFGAMLVVAVGILLTVLPMLIAR